MMDVCNGYPQRMIHPHIWSRVTPFLSKNFTVNWIGMCIISEDQYFVSNGVANDVFFNSCVKIQTKLLLK